MRSDRKDLKKGEMKKKMKCKYTHCRHESTEIKPGEAFDKIGRCYYHPDCNRERTKLSGIVSRFLEEVNSRVSVPELRKIITSLVYDEGYEAEYVEFALGYALEHPEYRLTYPPGMYRVCRSRDVAAAWQKKQDGDFIRNVGSDAFVAEEKEIKKITRKKTVSGFRRILGGV